MLCFAFAMLLAGAVAFGFEGAVVAACCVLVTACRILVFGDVVLLLATSFLVF